MVLLITIFSCFCKLSLTYCAGRTVPPLEELKQLIGRHGGKVMHYYSKSKCTHMVADNLPDTKVKQLMKEKLCVPVVRVKWILDSVAAGKKLPERPYLFDAFQQRWGGDVAGMLRAKPTETMSTVDTSGVHASNTAPQALSTPGQGSVVGEPQGGYSRHKGPLAQFVDVVPTRNSENTEGFMQKFYSASRLHFIGAFRSKVSAIVQQGMQEGGGQHGVHAASGAHAAADLHATLAAGAHGLALAQQHASKPFGGGRGVANLHQALNSSAATGHEHPLAGDIVSSDDEYMHEGAYGVDAAAAAPPGAVALRAASATVARTIVHIDMDCFFASVMLLQWPQYVHAPVAVAHTVHSGALGDNGRGVPQPAAKKGVGGEISSANYVARKFGVKGGMWMASAVKLCPDLMVLPYDFEAIDRASRAVFSTLVRFAKGDCRILDVKGQLVRQHTVHGQVNAVQAMSCDEAYLDISGTPDAEAFVGVLREAIFACTGCTASAGIARNKLLARLSTREAKPNGQMMLPASDVAVERFLAPMSVAVMPGIGWATQRKLQEERGITTVLQLQGSPLISLQEWFGPIAGEVLYKAARGDDGDIEVQQETTRKSVSAEVNWGIRFSTQDKLRAFVQELCMECARRLQAALVLATHTPHIFAQPNHMSGARKLRVAAFVGRGITLKAMRRRADAPEAVKHLGHGLCDSLSRMVTPPFPVLVRERVLFPGADEADDGGVLAAGEAITKHVLRLMDGLDVPIGDYRGLGVSLSRLEQQQARVRIPAELHTAPAVSSLDINAAATAQAASPLHAADDAAPGHGTPIQPELQQADLAPNLSQADPQVWAALPRHIAAEYMQDTVGRRGRKRGRMHSFLQPNMKQSGGEHISTPMQQAYTCIEDSQVLELSSSPSGAGTEAAEVGARAATPSDGYSQQADAVVPGGCSSAEEGDGQDLSQDSEATIIEPSGNGGDDLPQGLIQGGDTDAGSDSDTDARMVAQVQLLKPPPLRRGAPPAALDARGARRRAFWAARQASPPSGTPRPTDLTALSLSPVTDVDSSMEMPPPTKSARGSTVPEGFSAGLWGALGAQVQAEVRSALEATAASQSSIMLLDESQDLHTAGVNRVQGGGTAGVVGGRQTDIAIWKSAYGLTGVRSGNTVEQALSESQVEGLDAAGVDRRVLGELPLHLRAQVLEEGKAAARRRRLQIEREARSQAWGQARVAHVPSAEQRDEMQARQLAAAALPQSLSMHTALAAQERILRGIQRQREAAAAQAAADAEAAAAVQLLEDTPDALREWHLAAYTGRALKAKQRIAAKAKAASREDTGALPVLPVEQRAELWRLARAAPLPLSHPVWVIRLAIAPLLQGYTGIAEHLLGLGQCLPAEPDAFSLAALQGVAIGQAAQVLACLAQLRGLLCDEGAALAQVQQTSELVQRAVRTMARLGRNGAPVLLRELGLQGGAAAEQLRDTSFDTIVSL